MLKVLKWLIFLGAIALLYQMIDIAIMLDLPKSECMARGAEIIVQEGSSVCRYLRK